jgi:HD-like signal output (HDOD) protein
MQLEVFGTTHAEVGAYLMGLWGIPGAIVEALAFHHCPNSCPTRSFSPLTAIHVANGLAHLQNLAEEETMDMINLDYLNGLGLSHRLPVWPTASKDYLQRESCEHRDAERTTRAWIR